MLILDDILLFPIRGIVWAFRKVHDAAKEELANEAEAITAELRELHAMLANSRVTEKEFDAREEKLLDRLEQIEGGATDIEAEDEETEEENMAGVESRQGGAGKV